MPLELDVRQKQQIRRRRFNPYYGYTAFDSFTRADSASSLGSATEKGGAWTVLLGTAGISGNKGYAVGVETRAIIPAVLPGTNGTVTATLSSADWTNHPIDLMYRVTDVNNFLALTITAANSAQIRTMIAGTLTSFQVMTLNPSLSINTPYVFKTVLSGTSVSIYQDGVLLSPSPVTLTGGAAAISGTGAGFWVIAGTGNDATTNIDNFTVTSP